VKRLGWTALLIGAAAFAEGVGEQGKGSRFQLQGATTLMRAGKSLVSLGGSTLRRLEPGSRRWETVHAVKGDNLYRIATDEGGRVLASWEKDASLYLFTPGEREPKRVAKPSTPTRMSVNAIALVGSDALVAMSGEHRGTNCSLRAHAGYRVPLDGSAPTRLWESVGGQLLRLSAKGAILSAERLPDRGCNHHVSAIIGFALDGTPATLFSTDRLPHAVERVAMVRGHDEAAIVSFGLSAGRALVRWDGRGGTEPVRLPNIPDGSIGGGGTLLTPEGELIQVTTLEEGDLLEVRRRSADGREEKVTLPALQHIEPGVFGMGLRPGGELWVHWGDHLALLMPGKPARAYSIESMVDRRIEWAGADIYLEGPEESLWIGLDSGTGRHFERVRFDAVDRGAKPWRAP
jgi:hypothetical protein